MDITINIKQLEFLLDEQKRLVIEKLQQHTSYWNAESTDTHLKPVSINKDRFIEQGLKAQFPEDLIVLQRYLK